MVEPTVIGDVGFPSGIPIAILFPFFFVGMWCFVCFIISRFGWSAWAEIYRCDRQLQGKSYSGRSGQFNFQGCYNRAFGHASLAGGASSTPASVVESRWRGGEELFFLPYSPNHDFRCGQNVLLRTTDFCEDGIRDSCARLPWPALPEQASVAYVAPGKNSLKIPLALYQLVN